MKKITFFLLGILVFTACGGETEEQHFDSTTPRGSSGGNMTVLIR